MIMMKEAMELRHTVRKYTNQKISQELLDKINERLDDNNKKFGLSMKLMIDNTSAFGPFFKMILAKGVRNYIVLVGENTEDVDEKLGYCSSELMLFVQTLGLNSWWVGGTFNKKGVKKMLGMDEMMKMVGIVAIGYGVNQGVPHKSKSIEDISRYNGEIPTWFTSGVQAVLLAPTALNKQAFMIEGEGKKVKLVCNSGSFANVDLGIAKHHFELGAGKENFEWA